MNNRKRFISTLMMIYAVLVGCNAANQEQMDEMFGVRGLPEVNINLLAINPDQKNLFLNEEYQFTATGGDQPYIFKMKSGIGSVTQTGNYTAPSFAGQSTIQVTDAEGREAFAIITVREKVGITPTSGTIGSGQTINFLGTNGVPPYTFKIVSGGGVIGETSGVYDSTGFVNGMAVIEVKDTTGDTAYASVQVNPLLEIDPTAVTLGFAETQAFSASGGDPPYTFTLLSGGGSIAPDGTYTAPSTAGSALVRLSDSSSNTADATITIINKPTFDSHQASVGFDQNITFTASNGVPPYTYSISNGSGAIVAGTGVFTASSTIETVTIRVTDTAANYDETTVTVFKTKRLAASVRSACVLEFPSETSSTGKCWGLSAEGWYEVGALASHQPSTYIGDDIAEMGDNLPTINVGTGVTVDHVISGRYRSCIIASDNQMKCWGSGSYGALMNGSGLNVGNTLSEMGDSLAWIDLGVGRSVKSTLEGEAAVAIGEWHTCVIMDNDELKCWGRGTYGATGLSTQTYYGDSIAEIGDGIPNVNLGGATPIQVSTEHYHTCVLVSTGDVKCWGYNPYGQLGYEDTANRGDNEHPNSYGYVDLGTGYTATKICTGYHHTCALLNDNNIKCWGYNGHGNLGQGISGHQGDGAGEMGDNLALVDLGFGKTATDLNCGGYSTCATLNDGSVKCWGYNNNGQLGQGNGSNQGTAPDQMGDALSKIITPTGRTISDIWMQDYVTCIKLDNGDSQCYGEGRFAQSGQGHTYDIGKSALSMGDNLPILDVGTGRTVVEFAPARYHNCALLDNGDLKCWGQDYRGARGTGDAIIGDEPSDMGSNLKTMEMGSDWYFTAIKAHHWMNCGLSNQGDLYCWGYNYLGGLGLGNYRLRQGYDSSHLGDNWQKVDFGFGRTVKDFAVGYAGGCAILDNDKVKCWGYGGYGRTGHENGAHRGDGAGEMGDSLKYSDLGAGITAKKVSQGGYHSCVIDSNDNVRCFGRSNYGQLGMENTASLGDEAGEMGAGLGVTNIGSGRTAKEICSGWEYNCVVTDEDKVKCWGRSNYLGIGAASHMGDAGSEMGDNLPYVNLGTGRTVKKISCGGYHTCAILDNDDLKCWGSGSNGRLGNGSTATIGDQIAEMGDNLDPVNVGTGRTVIDVEAGWDFTCVVLDNNDVKCWGYNESGQLGLGHVNSVGETPVSMGNALSPVDLD